MTRKHNLLLSNKLAYFSMPLKRSANMPETAKKYLPYLLLVVFSVPLFFLNVHNAHSPGGDDYAQYIKEAQNIANGNPYYQSNYVFNKYNNCYSPPQYPPGFPLMLAPVVKMYGIAIAPMCYFNTVLAVCLLLAFFAYFRKHTGDTAALCLSILITYSGCMIDIKQSVLSDVPSMLFVMLYLIARNAKSFSWRRVALLAALATMAILIRTQSVLLLFAEAIYLFIFVLKEWKKEKRFSLKFISGQPSLYVIAGALLLTVFLNKVVFYCPTSATGFYVDFLGITLQKGLITIVRDNVNFLLTSITNFFHYETDNSIRTAMVTVMENFGLVFCILGFIITLKKRFSFDDIFFVLVCGLVLYYPIHDLRYFFPVIAIVFFYCYTALDTIIPVTTKIRRRHIGFALTAIYLVAGLRYLKSTTNRSPAGYVPEVRDRQAFSYLAEHVNDSDIIICARPRLITLYTNKRCMIHAWQHDMATNKKIFDEVHAKYLLLVNGFVDDYYKTYLRDYGHPTDSTTIATGYTLYTLR